MSLQIGKRYKTADGRDCMILGTTPDETLYIGWVKERAGGGYRAARWSLEGKNALSTRNIVDNVSRLYEKLNIEQRKVLSFMYFKVGSGEARNMVRLLIGDKDLGHDDVDELMRKCSRATES